MRVLVVLAAGSVQAMACEPCATELNADESMRAADLIIVGQRTDFSPTEIEQWQRQEGPGIITVKVLGVLKGRADRQTLTIHSWSAMCSFGIVVDDQPYVMLLQRRAEFASDYDSVNYGCAVKTLLVDGGQVEVNGQRLSLEALKAYLEALATRGG